MPAAPPRPVRAVLFDFDGTLADSYAAITASVNHVLATLGRPPLPQERIRTMVGHGLQHLMHDIAPDRDPDELARVYRAHHPSVMVPLTRLLPGVADTLHELARRGVKMGICSNKPARFTRELAERLGLGEALTVALGPEDVAAPKPAPDMIWAALGKLAVGPDEAIYVGDMTVDIETGKAAGVPTYVLATGSNDAATLRAAQPDGLLESFGQILELVPGE